MYLCHSVPEPITLGVHRHVGVGLQEFVSVRLMLFTLPQRQPCPGLNEKADGYIYTMPPYYSHFFHYLDNEKDSGLILVSVIEISLICCCFTNYKATDVKVNLFCGMM